MHDLLAFNTSPYELFVYDKSRLKKGRVTAPLSLTCVPMFNEVGTTNIILDDQDPNVAKLVDPGARLHVWHRGKLLSTGNITNWELEGDGAVGIASFDMEDDLSVLASVTGWVKPTGTVTGVVINGQGDEDAHYTVTGPAETVLKQIVTANAVTRLGMPLTVAPTQGRGEVITISSRFDSIEELLPQIGLAGLGVTVKQIGANLVLDVYEPTTHRKRISTNGGVISKYKFVTSAPTATRIILGGAGREKDRLFRRYIDAPRETEWGRIIEVFIDARDLGNEYRNHLGQVERLTKKVADELEDLREERVDLASAQRARDNADVIYENAKDSGNSASISRAQARFNSLVQQLNNAISRKATAQADYDNALNELNTEKAKFTGIMTRYEADMARRAKEKLAEMGPSSGVALTLKETDYFTYGGEKGVVVGDTIPLDIKGVLSNEILKSAKLEWTPEEGEDNTPSIGDVSDDPDVLTRKALLRIAKRVGNVERVSL